MKQHPRRARISVDLSVRDGRPLSKDRISIYNSGLVPFERYDRDKEYFTDSGAESLRIDLGWGAEWMPWTTQQVSVGSDGAAQYAFEETDRLADLLESTNTRPYWSYCYVPIAARPDGGDWRTMAESNDLWVDMVRNYVVHARERGNRIGYHEVYNEPDLRDERTAEPVFYSGDLDDYLELYRQTSAAIREADPTARVGGPALAFPLINSHWLERFLSMVVAERLPLDFVSFHHYGTFSVEGSLDLVDQAVAAVDLPYLETHLNEYNSFQIDYPQGGLQDTHLLASAFAADLPRLLDRPGLTKVSWAQFLDSGEGNFSGMVTIDGVRKPLYEVYEFYQRMPLERRLVEVEGPAGVGALASSDDHGASFLVWNRHFAELSIDLEVTALDASDAALKIIGPAPQDEQRVDIVDGRLTIVVPSGAVALLQVDEKSAPVEVRAVQRAYLRKPDRAKDGWVDVDEASGAIMFGVHEQGARLVAAADFGVDAHPSGWNALIHDANGRPVSGSLSVRVSRGHEVEHLAFGDPTDSEVAWSQVAPASEHDGYRVVAVLAGAPAGSFATLQPAATS